MSSGERISLINSSSAERDHERRNSVIERLDKILRPLTAEFLGTCLFVFVACMSVQDAEDGSISIAVGHGFTIALLVVATGKISGGHLNPAVTLGIALSGAIPVPLALAYVLAQLLGGMTGAAFVRAVLPLTTFTNISGGAHILNPSQNGVEPGQAVAIEMLLTLVLVLTVLLAAVDEDSKTDLAPLAIGFAVTVDILAGIHATGASMNPARSFGPALAVSQYNSNVWTYHYVYWAGPFLGSIAASAFYRLVFATPSKRLFRPPAD